MQNKMITFVSKEIISHVKSGGWIGASWPNYIAGANALDNDGLALALGRAEREYGYLWVDSQSNFEDAAEEEEEILSDTVRKIITAAERSMDVFKHLNGTYGSYARKDIADYIAMSDREYKKLRDGYVELLSWG